MNLQSVSIETLKQVVSIKEEIASLEGKLARLIGGKEVAAVAPEATAKKVRKGMSQAVRAKIAAAQKARWAKVKAPAPASAKAAPSAKPAKKKRTLSPEHKAKLMAALKARWAAKKAKSKS